MVIRLQWIQTQIFITLFRFIYGQNKQTLTQFFRGILERLDSLCVIFFRVLFTFSDLFFSQVFAFRDFSTFRIWIQIQSPNFLLIRGLTDENKVRGL